ncbi:MAG: transporter [Chromatiales bacterium]
MNANRIILQFAMLIVLSGTQLTVSADLSQAQLAKMLANPIANLTSVPFQYNYDQDMGVDGKGDRNLINIQPVVPFEISKEWNIISRTILPLISQDDVVPGTSESGIGDITESLFFSPKEPTAGGWVWGVGPVLLLPTASDDQLGGGKWGLGPTGVALKQEKGWTYGALANHVWSVAGDDDRSDINSTFLQPFLAYTTPRHTTITINTESTYNWENEQWSVPINLMLTQLFKVGDQPMSLQLGARYWADSPDTGPEGWGLRLTYTLVFPRR